MAYIVAKVHHGSAGHISEGEGEGELAVAVWQLRGEAGADRGSERQIPHYARDDAGGNDGAAAARLGRRALQRQERAGRGPDESG
jgi:hypothetical protein